MIRKPARSCRAMLARFSGKTPDWTVQIPAASVEAISRSSSARPTPRPRAAASTYTLCSTTPAYTGRADTGLTAIQPSTWSPSAATHRCAASRPASKAAQSGADVSKLASPPSSAAW